MTRYCDDPGSHQNNVDNDLMDKAKLRAADRALAGAPEIGSRVFSPKSQRRGIVKRFSKTGRRALVHWTLAAHNFSSWVSLDNIRVV